MIEATVAILVAKTLSSKTDGERLLRLLSSHLPQHLPERFGDAEPLNSKFDPRNFHSALDVWGKFNFIAERLHPRVLLQVLFWPPVSRDPRHSSIALIRFQSEQDIDIERLSAFVEEVTSTFEADYAVAHILTATELEDRLENLRHRATSWPQAPAESTVARLRRRIDKEGFASVLWSMDMAQNCTVQLRKCLQDLYWLNVFGSPYVEMFGRERLLATPGFAVKELSNSSISVRLAGVLNDTDSCWKTFKTARDKCKIHLACDAFFNPQAPADYVYRSPNFNFPLEMYKR
jgi:hypothetical protein